VRRLLFVLLALVGLLGAECQRPVPTGVGGSPATGGAVATGGNSSVGGGVATGGSEATGGARATGGASQLDGYAVCVAAVKADPGRAAQARDNGMTVAALASVVCSFDSVQDCYAKGICQ
jgi:hypothetical protein